MRNNLALVRATEGLIAAGMLSMWAGLVHYHITNQDFVVPPQYPQNHSAIKAMIAMQPHLEGAAFYLVVLGACLAGGMGFLGLFLLDSKQKPNFVGVFASFVITGSAWHLFRIESEDTLERYLGEPGKTDLWGPITSNVVMLSMAMILMQLNLFKIWLFSKMPLTARLVCRFSVITGVLSAQMYFSIMLLLSYTAGLVLLAASPFLMLFGYVGGQLWEYLHLRAEAAKATPDEKEALTNPQEP